MKNLARFYKVINLLSIDVAFGAVISALFFARLLHVHVLPYGSACLGLTVWIIYTADHLFDAWKIKTRASTARHTFHQRHFKSLVMILAIVVVIDLSLALFIRAQVFRWGVGLTGVVCVYFLIQSNLRFLKEWVGALLYSMGVLLPSLPVTEKPISSFSVLLIGQFVITALINLILFSWFDYSHDLQDNQSSLITALGHRAGRVLLSGLFLLQGVITAYLLICANEGLAVLVVAAMNLTLLIIFWRSAYFSIHDRYRFVGDAIFFFPFLYLLH